MTKLKNLIGTTQIVTELKNSISDKTKKVVVVTPGQPMRCSWASFCDSRDVLGKKARRMTLSVFSKFLGLSGIF